MNVSTAKNTHFFDTAYVDVNNFQIFQRCSKTNHSETIVLIHGINVSEKYFRPFAIELQNRFNVIAIDLPGYGKSTKIDDALTITQLADIVAAYLNQHVGQPITLIGQSMGTQVCAKVAALHPKIIHRLILLAPTINRSERNIFIQAMRLLQDSLKEPLIVTLIIFSDFLRFGIKRFLKTQKSMLEDRIEDTMKTVRVATLLVAGEKDPIATLSWVKQLARSIPNQEIAIVKDAPHNFQFTHPKALYNICINFLER